MTLETRFWWVRHGPTHEKAFTGWRDVPADLSDRDAIARLDSALPRGAVLQSSDLMRAVATADVLAQGRSRLPHDPNLREMHFGDWDGLHWSEVAARDPQLSRAFWEAPGDHSAPGGESWNATANRISGAVDALLRDQGGRDIILVAHMGAILTQFQRAAGIGASEAVAQRIEPLSITCLIHGDGWRVGQVNHLP